ncbi:putative MFS transporter [Aureobasidium subglaciale]|nr:putative MFS transporter [Aureobasidium subglaciale]KAI5228113.1 putative MFS transporter [Aureobasidium subglaciale]KAI5231534.1 putative MFS transporter [Aureobasidium subglaciale]KAI5265396.1 putative MFS transporter [Aureobasidium subglaciale]
MRASHELDKEGHAAMHKELAHETAQEVAARGVAATDQYGNSLLQFDAKAEAKLRTKIDFMVIPTVMVLYLFCFIDRANIGLSNTITPCNEHYLTIDTGNAKIAHLEKDLAGFFEPECSGLTGYDYNAVLSVFYISYIIFEIPSNMACKWIGPGWFIPGISLAFGLCSIATAYVHNFSQMCAVRFVLGIFEAGMLPGIAYYLSRWYRRSELAFRLALYVVAAPLAGAFGGLLASAILRLDSFAGLHAWRMIFAIEGIVTVCLSLIGFFTLTDRPATARWLSQEEKDLAISRVKSERVGATEVLDKFDRKKIFKGIFSPVTLGTAAIFMLNNVTVQGLAFFAPTIVRTIYPHNTVVSQQLHTVPPYVVGGFFCLLFPYISWKTDRRLLILICSAPLVMVGYIMFLASEAPMVRYGATFIIASGAFAFGSLCNAQVSANVVSDTARSSAIGTNVMFGNIGGLIATWSFLPFDGPNYHIGNGLNLGTSTTMLCLCIALLFWMKRDNKVRESRDVDQELAGTTLLEQQDMDWKHPSWRWRP